MNKDIDKDIIESVKMLKKYCDIQSKRIDLLEARCRRLEDKTENVPIIETIVKEHVQPSSFEGRKDQDLIDKKWRAVSKLGI